MPHARIAIINSEVATGLRMKMRDGFMCAPRLRRCQPQVQQCLQPGASTGGSLRAERVRAGRAPAAAESPLAVATEVAAAEVVLRVLRRGSVDRRVGGQLHRRAVAQAIAAL